MFSIPEELLEQFERNNVIPLVGEGVNHSMLPLAEEMAHKLAERCDYPEDEPKTLRRVAEYYELITRDRHSLITFLRDQIDRPELEPTLGQKLIAQLRPRVAVTISYDRQLERAFQAKAVPYTSVVANEEVAYGDERKTLLVWLWGVIDRPDSLIITEDDHNRFLNDRNNLSDVLRGELSRHTWLFLGFDTEDPWFRNYYNGVTRGLDSHRRRSYVVETSLSEYTRAWWADKAQIIDVEVEPFLIELNKQLVARRQPVTPKPLSVQSASAETASLPLPERPYKFLDYYEAKDAPIFFGRNAEIQTLSSLIHAHRLVLLYSASGAGKTSLLLAGVAPRLEGAEPGYETIYLRVRDSPVDIIRRSVRRRLAEVDLPEDGSLVDFLGAATMTIDRTLVIVLDQFEEFFMRLSATSRQAFVAELGELYDDPDVRVKIVISLREDWLASVNEIRERIPEIFNIDLRLLPLTREQAQQAITAPAEKLGIGYDPALVDQMLQDLMEGTIVDEGSSVNPPQLQLVCDALYEHAHSNNRQHITLSDYESMGGTQGILDSYIENALRKHPGDERELAKELLIALVTSHQTKARQDLEILSKELGVDESEVEQVLARLTGQRLVRRLDDGHSYELAHDILAVTIATWFDEEERQRKQVQELLNRELVDWHQDPNALLSHGKFRQIEAARDSLRFTEEEAAFLLRAAVLYDMDIPYWLARVNNSDAEIEILLEMLKSDNSQARLTSAKILVNYAQDRSAIALAHTALDDPLPQVRDMTAVSLGLMGGQVGINFLTEVVLEKENPRRSRALRALARVRDVAPDQLIDVSGTNRFHVFLDLAKIRFQRDWPTIRRVTIAGAIGGALGFGLGLFLPMANQVTQITGGSLRDLVFIMPVMALFGLLAGAVMAVGISGAESLKRERAGIARIVGGTLLGWSGFAIALSFFAFVDSQGFSDSLLNIIGGGLFGALIALGITLPAAFTSRRVAMLIGGALGGGLGIVAWGVLGYEPVQVQTLRLPMLLASGGLTGFIMALSITLAYSRSAPEGKEKKEDDSDRFDRTQAIEGTSINQ